MPPKLNRIIADPAVEKGLADLKNLYHQYYYFSDDSVIDLVLGVVAGNHLDSDPIWLHLISPPSGGKTELLFSIKNCPEVYFMSDLTAASLISGYKSPPKSTKEGETEADKDHSKLPLLNGKVVVTKDFTVICDKPAESRSQILSMLRDVYDGYSSRLLGNMDSKGFHARFNYLTGMTPDIEKAWNLNTLGERFLMYRLSIKDRKEHARWSLLNANRTSTIREEIQTAVQRFMASLPRGQSPTVPDYVIDRILHLANILAVGRSYVHRDRNDQFICLPQTELAGRVAKQLLRIGQSVAVVRGKPAVTSAEIPIMRRVALDSLPSNRRELLALLWANRNIGRGWELFSAAIPRLSKSTIKRELENLAYLGAVTKGAAPTVSGRGTTVTYQLAPGFTKSCAQIDGISKVKYQTCE